MAESFWLFLLVFIIIDLIIIFFVIFRRKKFDKRDRCEFEKRWKEIKASDNANALLGADKLLHYYLGKMGYTGSMGEILKRNPGLFSKIDDVWYVHKQRNKLAHELGFKIGDAEKNRIMRIFQDAFRDIGLY